MPDRIDELESRVEALARELREIQSRLRRLEGRAAPGPAEGPAPTPPEPGGAEAPTLAPELSQGTLAFTGRTLVALGGGYLIRALTDAGFLPVVAGVGLGLGYALLWLGLADRAARAGQRSSAAFHGLASGLIAYPLLWEATLRFGLFRPRGALAAVVAVFAAGIAVAARRRLGAVAWAFTSLALGTGAGLLVSTHALLAAVLALLAVAGIVESLAVRDFWPGLRWPAALTLDVAVVIMVLLGSRPAGLPEGYPDLPLPGAIAAALAVSGLYLASVVARTLGRGCPVTGFELLQGTSALLLGFAGAWTLLRSQGEPGTSLGAAGLLLGVLCYGTAFAFVERRKGHGRNFYFYSSAGGVLILVGSLAVFEGAGLTLAWCLLALASCGLGRRFRRMTLRVHGALYVGAAALGAGVVGGGSLAPAGGDFRLPGPAGWMAVATAVSCYAVLATGRLPWTRWWERLAPAIVAAFGVYALGGIAVAGLVTAGGSASSPAVVAAIRTGVLALLALGLAAAARRWSLPELGWFVYPVLAVAGLKLVTEDLRHGRPATLFLGFVLYGGALILAPRLLRRDG